MSRSSSSVAPKERINIKYVPATGDQQAEIELPHKMLVLGDFGLNDPRPLKIARSCVSTSTASTMC